MTQRDDRELWEAILDDLDIDAPSGSRRDEWVPVYQSFGERGFVRLTRHRTQSKIRVQLALPGSSVTATRTAIVEWLAGFDLEPPYPGESDDDSTTQNGSEPADNAVAVEAPLPEERDDTLLKNLTGIVESVQAAGDAIRTDDMSKLPDWLATAGDDDGASTRATATADPDETRSSLFEPIGAEASDSDGSGSDQTQTDGDVDFDLAGYDTVSSSSRDAGARLQLNFESPIPSTAIDEFAEALAHSLRARFDVNATLETGDMAPGPTDSIVISVEPTASAPPDTDPTTATTDYLDRLIRFRKLGVPVAESIGLRDTPGDSPPAGSSNQPRAQQRSDQRQPDDPDDSDSRQGTDTEAAPGQPTTDSNETSDEQITLGGGSTGTDTPAADSSDETTLEKTEDDTPTGPLETGHFTDPRLMRDDATTSLVDVILRHPGYRDERMAQVLSILLSLDYPDAKQLVNQAPTHLAWGVGRERAQRLKRVVEDTGGKIIFVEPDSIPS